MEGISDKVERIAAQRNNYFVHLAREYLSGDFDKLFGDFPVSFNDIGDVLNTLGEILNRASAMLLDSSTLMGFIGEEHDINMPLDLLNEAVEAKRAEQQRIFEAIQSGNPPKDIKWPKY